MPNNLNNDLMEKEIAKSLSTLTGVRDSVAKSFMHTMYLERIHKVACDAMRADSKLHKFQIEIPYIGILHFRYEDGVVSVDHMDYKPRFLVDVTNALNKGESELLNQLNKKFIDQLNKTYEELI